MPSYFQPLVCSLLLQSLLPDLFLLPFLVLLPLLLLLLLLFLLLLLLLSRTEAASQEANLAVVP
jgi:hypothetical protein